MAALPVAEPINRTPPTAADLARTAELVEFLKQNNLFETPTGMQNREVVLGTLNAIIREWIRTILVKKKGFSEQEAREAGGNIYTFGSYRLGVAAAGTDIDTLCVGPQHVDREHFFLELLDMLTSRPEVKKLQPVPEAYVPVVTFEFNGVEIDLLYAKLMMNSIPEALDLTDDAILNNVDPKSILSLNGCRVTDMILKLVPNIDNFRNCLRAIKFWAKSRKIYSNKVGFLGGVSWAILTAFVCQLYPAAAPSTLLAKFFNLYEQWKWPAPVRLIKQQPSTMGLRVWDAKVNRLDLMPIITPAYPSINSTYNVSRSNLAVLKEEFARGAKIAAEIETKGAKWRDLFQKMEFFDMYKNYIQVDVSGANEEDHRLWTHYVEARLRVLIVNLEGATLVTRVHPYPKPRKNPDDSRGITSSFFLGLTFNFPPVGKKSIDLSRPVEEFKLTLQTGFRASEAPMLVEIAHIRKKQLPDFVFDGEAPKKSKKSRKSTKGDDKAEESRAAKGDDDASDPGGEFAAPQDPSEAAAPRTRTSPPATPAPDIPPVPAADVIVVEDGTDTPASRPPAPAPLPSLAKPDFLKLDAAAGLTTPGGRGFAETNGRAASPVAESVGTKRKREDEDEAGHPEEHPDKRQKLDNGGP